ncbi:MULTISPECIES: biotin/lipoyl-containing protein [Alistipes]|uniref:Acetyl-CoA carboxylase biotin carboxyl carrier protein subunit n=2 Tax=Alistipes TaxID=239759 RepID=A0ABY5V5T7_9BACT|nr:MULTISPECIES: biotin/lipoyl-containing protein [Alistipes]MBD9302693.1 acetyl-CoA carboxylase biotin carboxyl carrier protein subunit [Alistipes senegalensis]MBQ7892389.1 acetyl-CoA carboxylase biotin carboxyl carrier protein subunit [Alistipes sp.]MDY5240828.1 biotin/lipoyl-containing protein [Alistipes senegalensis]UEA87552.1 acetyl-CoA carboxylase biotin carboxyl carrier protein subunit [Alistipes senegalensis]UWN64857.1 acetyl-CoA carboxylase biotin carboxyl carrier protein subunit [Ali
MKDYSLKINGHNYSVQIDDVNEASTVAHVVVNGVDYEVEIEGAKASTVSKPQVAPAPKSANSAMITPSSATPSPRIAAAAPSSGYSVKCPLPGTVLSVKVAAGDTIAAGQTLVVLEAMKMENNIDADRGGVVKQVLVQQGATVMEGDVLIVIE